MATRAEPSKLRRRLRRAAQCLVGLVLLAAATFVLADVWHQYTLGKSVNRLREQIDRVEVEVTEGVPARDWHETRIKGTNGWKHVKFLWEAADAERFLEEEYGPYTAGKSPQVRLWKAIEQFADIERDTWEATWPEEVPDDYEPRRTPNHLELEDMLFETRDIPQAVKLAAQCDTITPVPKEGAGREEWIQNLNPFDTGAISHATIGRVKALRELGRTEDAELELVTAADFLSKFNLPMSFMDGLFCVQTGRTVLSYAGSLLCQGQLSVSAAESILGLQFDGDRLLREAMLAELVWAVLFAHREPNLLEDPRWFEWMSEKQSAWNGSVGGNLVSRYGYRAEGCDYVALGFENTLRTLDQVKHNRPWAELAQTRFLDEYQWGVPAEWLPKHSMTFRSVNIAWLALKLRLMEAQVGPLAAHREEVSALIARYPFARHEWNGDTLNLYTVPQFEFDPDKQEILNYYPTELAPAN